MSTDAVDSRRRRFLTGAVTVVGGVGGVCTAWPFASAWQPSERARAIGAPVEIDISKLEPGAMLTEAWQGKPVWILGRTSEALQSVADLNDAVRDPDSAEDQQPGYARNQYRSRRPEILVLVGLCTHLGCSPKHVRVEQASYFGIADWRGGFFCPCHGSMFDYAGRVFKGVPAPTNLVVPPYQFLSDTVLLIGDDGQETA
jgi:ubiquinol-cytochrome c reductase iron-sulfur subunit